VVPSFLPWQGTRGDPSSQYGEGHALNLHHLRLSGALAASLLFVLLVSCAGQPKSVTAEQIRAEDNSAPSTIAEPTNPGEREPDSKSGGPDGGKPDAGKTVKAVLPKDVLSEKDLHNAPPKYEDWHKESSSSGGTGTSGTTAGAIPAVQPFNFGRDPGGPEDKTLYLTVPKLGLDHVAAYNSVSEEKLKKSTVHIPATGFPWQKGANTYIAGHRLGYEGTDSYLVFYYLDQLSEGDEILLEDSAGATYTYRVIDQKVVDPDSVEVMEPEEGKSLVSLQTCTLPDYKQRLIVQGELIDRST
jgi:sortase A